MEFFLKNKIVLLRVAGALMLVVGFAVHFWVSPQKGLSKNQIAAANIARMKVKVASNTNSDSSKRREASKLLKRLKDTQEKQMRYLTIISMILGVGFLGYSFIPKRDSKR